MTVSIGLFFFLQGNNTHTVLHIIDNIELKRDFANLKSQIKSQSQYLSKNLQLDIFSKSHSPNAMYSKVMTQFVFISWNVSPLHPQGPGTHTKTKVKRSSKTKRNGKLF